MNSNSGLSPSARPAPMVEKADLPAVRLPERKPPEKRTSSIPPLVEPVASGSSAPLSKPPLPAPDLELSDDGEEVDASTGELVTPAKPAIHEDSEEYRISHLPRAPILPDFSTPPSQIPSTPLTDIIYASGVVEPGTIRPPPPIVNPLEADLSILSASVAEEENDMKVLDGSISLDARGEGPQSEESKSALIGACRKVSSGVVEQRIRIAEAYELLAQSATDENGRIRLLNEATENRRAACKALAKLAKYYRALGDTDAQKTSFVNAITQNEICALRFIEMGHTKDAEDRYSKAKRLSEALATILSNEVAELMKPKIDPKTKKIIPPDYQAAFDTASREVQVREEIMKLSQRSTVSLPPGVPGDAVADGSERPERESEIDVVNVSSVSSEITPDRRRKFSEAYRRLAILAAVLNHGDLDVVDYLLKADTWESIVPDGSVDRAKELACAYHGAYSIYDDLVKETLQEEHTLKSRSSEAAKKVRERLLKYLSHAADLAETTAINYKEGDSTRHAIYFWKLAALKHVQAGTFYGEANDPGLAAMSFKRGIEAIENCQRLRSELRPYEKNPTDGKTDTEDSEFKWKWLYHRGIQWGNSGEQYQSQIQTQAAMNAYSHAVVDLLEYLELFDSPKAAGLSPPHASKGLEKRLLQTAVHGAYFASKAMSIGDEAFPESSEAITRWIANQSKLEASLSRLCELAITNAERTVKLRQISEEELLVLKDAVKDPNPKAFMDFLMCFV